MICVDTNDKQYDHNKQFYADGAVHSLGIPFSANRRPRLPWRHHWKALHCRSTSHGKLCQLDCIAIARGLSDLIVIVSLYRLKMHTSSNFLDIHNDGINPFTLSTRREMCSLESFCYIYMLYVFAIYICFIINHVTCNALPCLFVQALISLPQLWHTVPVKHDPMPGSRLLCQKGIDLSGWYYH